MDSSCIPEAAMDESSGTADADNQLNEARDLLAKLSIQSDIPGIRFVNYKDESQLHHVMRLVGDDLSEPYSSE